VTETSFRVTYATLSAEDERVDAEFDRGLEVASGWLGAGHSSVVGGEPRDGAGTYETRSPIDTEREIGRFAVASKGDVADAVVTAREAAGAWVATPWQDRAAILDRAADLISERRSELAALMTLEVGKTRLEALGDVDYPRPVVCEMGGKNPVVVTASSDLETAVEGTARSAFGLAGQKCSSASRVYVEEPIAGAFLDRLAERTRSLVVGDPTRKETFVGPVIDEAAVERFERAVAEASVRGEVLVGGRRATGDGLDRGYFLEPTVVSVPDDSWLWTTELFCPLVAVRRVGGLDEAIARANATPFGLTAGFFGRREGEIERFLDRIEAGVVYVNRRAGATTGAWPGVQPFGGWKASGTSGKAGGGPYYLHQYLREQSRTIVS